jgi:hypothetical protein
MSEEHVDAMAKMQEMGQKLSKYMMSFKTHFKDMNVEIQDWNFSVGKQEKEYLLSFGCKVAISPKAKESKE